MLDLISLRLTPMFLGVKPNIISLNMPSKILKPFSLTNKDVHG